VSELTPTEGNGLRAEPRDLHDLLDPAPTDAICFDSREQAALLLVQGGQEHPHLPVVLAIRVIGLRKAARARALIGVRIRHRTHPDVYVFNEAVGPWAGPSARSDCPWVDQSESVAARQTRSDGNGFPMI
jgi:hypothetical protein